MNIDELDASVSRFPLGILPTPLVRADRLAQMFDLEHLWIKRDDLTGFSWGGNKVRAAEYLVAEAIDRRVGEVVVSGGPSSNFAAIMAAAGRVAGLRVHQVSYGIEPPTESAALLAGRGSGSSISYTGSADRRLMDEVGVRLASDRPNFGAQAIAIPRGGASDVGSIGFLRAGLEFIGQVSTAGIEPGVIVLPTGSGGSAAGLLAALGLLGSAWQLLAPSVSRPPNGFAQQIADKAVRSAALTGERLVARDLLDSLTVVDARGTGFGSTDPETSALIQTVQHETGLLIDPVYNAKALRWLCGHRPEAQRNHVYWFTGGTLGVVDHLLTTRSE